MFALSKAESCVLGVVLLCNNTQQATFANLPFSANSPRNGPRRSGPEAAHAEANVTTLAHRSHQGEGEGWRDAARMTTPYMRQK